MLARALLLASVVTLGPCQQEKTQPTEAPSASASASAAPVDTSVTFARALRVVGARHAGVADFSSKNLLTIEPGKGRRAIQREVTIQSSVKITEELLSANGAAPTKVKITFDKFEVRTTDATTSKAKPNRVAGKTFVVETKNGKIDVRDDKGRPAPKEDAAEVEKLYKGVLGKPDPFASTLPPTLRAGDVFDGAAKALEGLLVREGDGTTLSNVRAVFKEKQGDDGVFAVTMKMTKEDESILMLMDVTGELRISTKTAELSRFDASGPITVVTSPRSKTGTAFSGSGRMGLHLGTDPL